MEKTHKSGFISVIGEPNAGKSSLINILSSEKINSVTYKAQTTRHEIKCILNYKNYQLVFLDTPGYISEPKNKLHLNMNNKVINSIKTADIIVLLIDSNSKNYKDIEIYRYLKNHKNIILCYNKIDKIKTLNILKEKELYFKAILKPISSFSISCILKSNIETLKSFIFKTLPYSPPYYIKENDEISDRPIRFFISEIIRKNIFLLFKNEIPYCSFVQIEKFEKKDNISYIQCYVFVERESQKKIIIGKDGEKIKKLSTNSRIEIEEFINNKVFLDLTVKVKPNWRKNDSFVKKLLE